jgi:predicted PurR-regulated permease PerM
MTKKKTESQFNWGVGIGLSAVVGILVSAIVGMLRLSRPKEEVNSSDPAAKSASTAEQNAENTAPAAAQTMITSQVNPTVQRQKLPSAGAAASRAADGTQTVKSGSTSWSRGTKYFVAALLFLALIGIIYISSQSLSTIIFAALLTFIVHPIIKFFQRRFSMRRGSATLIVYLLVLGLILLIPFLLIPSVINSIQFLANIDYLELFESASEWLNQQAAMLSVIPLVGSSISSGLEQLAGILSDIAAQNPDASSTFEFSFENIGGRISQTLTFLGNVFGPLISIAVSVVFTLLISLHMSLSLDLLKDSSKKLVPPAYQPEISALVRKIILIWNSFLRGQLSLMVVVGVIVWIGNVLLGTPQALFLGVLAGLLEVIPSLGPVLATIPAVILALLFGSGYIPVENWAFALMVIVFYVLVQAVENQLLVPYILGDAVDLPPLFVIIGVVIGGSAFGLLGVFLATPVISTGREVFMYLYDKILEPPPEPPVLEEKPSIIDTIRGYASRLPRPKWLRERLESEEPSLAVIANEPPVKEQI